MKAKSTIMDLIKLALPYKGSIAILSVILLFHSLIQLVNPYLMKIVFDDALGKSNIKLLWILLFVFIGVRLFEAFCGILLDVQLTKIGTKILLDLRHDILAKVLMQDIHFFKENNVGKILFRLHDQMLVLFRAVGNFCVNIIARSLLIIGILIITFYMNAKLALLALLLIPLYYYIVTVSSKHINSANKIVMDGLSKIVEFLTESITGVMTIRVFSKEKYILDRHDEKTLDFNTKTIKITWISTFYNDLLGVISFISPILILCLGGIMYIHKEITLGQLISFYTYIGMLFAFVKGICEMVNGVQGSLVALDQINEYKCIGSIEDNNKKQINKIGQFENLVFSKVSYSYYEKNDEKKDVLRDIDLTITKGDKIAIVGSSGSGKTTLINLMLGIITPQKGSISFNGVSYESIMNSAIRDHFAVVTQDVFLFNDTIRENICLGSNATDEALKQYLTMADVYDDVMKLQNTYDFVVGARGERVSGGQKQRIGIARALFKNTDVLVLDEATSNIDAESERVIQESIVKVLDKSRNDTTIIIVTHRLSTVKHADIVVYIENGAISEIGTYDQLLKSRKGFYNLFAAQL